MAPRGIQPVEFGHLHIHEDQIGFGRGFHGEKTVYHMPGGHAEFLEQGADERGVHLIVLGDDDPGGREIVGDLGVEAGRQTGLGAARRLTGLQPGSRKRTGFPMACRGGARSLLP